MKYYIHSVHNPRYNLALEETLFRTAEDDIFMLWQNEPSVIIGKNQNPYTEVNLDYTAKEHINVVRRITGGGAVFHDFGNVNYTFITPAGSGEKDFRYFTQPIIEALGKMGLEACFSGRNDITTIDGRKISGNARVECDGRIMHHGTLLFDADMTKLTAALLVNQAKIESKGIKSVKSRVANIKELLPTPISVEEFISFVENHVRTRYGGETLVLSEEQIKAAEKLKSEKYDTDTWNLSLNLPFDIRNTNYFPFGLLEVSFTVKAGKIEAIRIMGDFFGVKDIAVLENLLLGADYTKETIFELLKMSDVGSMITGANPEDLLELLMKIN